MNDISRAVCRRSTLFHVRIGKTSTLLQSRAHIWGKAALLCGARVLLFFFARGLCAFLSLSSSCPTPLSLSLSALSLPREAPPSSSNGETGPASVRECPPLAPLSGSGFPIGQSTAPLGAGPSLKVTHPLFKHYSRL